MNVDGKPRIRLSGGRKPGPAGMLCAVALLAGTARGNSAELPEGLAFHGIAAPVGRQTFAPLWSAELGDSRFFATTDTEGRRTVFFKLWTGNNTSYLFIDVEPSFGSIGQTGQVYPEIDGRGGWPVFRSDDNKVYDTVGNWLLEIDLLTREIRRVGPIPSGMALSYAMDNDGVIHAGLYPGGAVVSYNPATGAYANHGALNNETWPQYVRPMAADAHGWIYAGIGQNLAQVAGLDPADGRKRVFVPAGSREPGQGKVFLGTDGQVYATAPGWGWHVLAAGAASPIAEPPVGALIRRTDLFPDGSRLASVDVANRTLRILDAGAQTTREVRFTYESPGVPIYSMIAGTDGNIYGATGIPLRIWRFNPGTGVLTDWGLADHSGHVNQFVRQRNKLYGAVYSSGSIIEFDPSRPFHDAHILQSSNPRHVHGYEYGHEGNPDMVGRPFAMVAHPDGRHVIMGGNPARVAAGGGLVIYDVETGTTTALLPEELIPGQGVMALAVLPGGDLIVGSTTAAGTGGVPAATEAVIYRLDWNSPGVIGTWKLNPPPRSIRDLVVGDDGLVYGMAAGNRFFVFDPETEQVIHDEAVSSYGPVAGGQAPRAMAISPDGGIHVLFRDAIARFEPGTFTHREIARPGFEINAGIVIDRVRLYFSSAGRLYSHALPSLDVEPVSMPLLFHFGTDPGRDSADNFLKSGFRTEDWSLGSMSLRQSRPDGATGAGYGNSSAVANVSDFVPGGNFALRSTVTATRFDGGGFTRLGLAFLGREAEGRSAPATDFFDTSLRFQWLPFRGAGGGELRLDAPGYGQILSGHPGNGELRHIFSGGESASFSTATTPSIVLGSVGSSPNRRFTAAVFFFALPELGSGEKIHSSAFSVVETGGRMDFDSFPEEGTAADLYGLGFLPMASLPTVGAVAFWKAGPPDPDESGIGIGGTRIIQEGVIRAPALAAGLGRGRFMTDREADLRLADFLNELYENGARTGDFAVLRLNLNRFWNPNIGHIARFELAGAGAVPGDEDPKLFIALSGPGRIGRTVELSALPGSPLSVAGGTRTFTVVGHHNSDGSLNLIGTLTSDDGAEAMLVSRFSPPPGLFQGTWFGISSRLREQDNPILDWHTFEMGTPEELGIPSPWLMAATFADWQALSFKAEDIPDPAISGPLAAPAGDGVANLAKYAFGLDPGSSAIRTGLPRAKVIDGRLHLTYRERIQARDIEYWPVTAGQLTGPWKSGPGHIEETDRFALGNGMEEVTVAAQLPEDAPKGFLRLKVKLLP